MGKKVESKKETVKIEILNPYQAPDKDKREGDSAEVVCWIQTQLGINVSGEYDRNTVEAVERYQKFKGLEVNGVVDKATRNALKVI